MTKIERGLGQVSQVRKRERGREGEKERERRTAQEPSEAGPRRRWLTRAGRAAGAEVEVTLERFETRPPAREGEECGGGPPSARGDGALGRVLAARPLSPDGAGAVPPPGSGAGVGYSPPELWHSDTNGSNYQNGSNYENGSNGNAHGAPSPPGSPGAGVAHGLGVAFARSASGSGLLVKRVAPGGAAAGALAAGDVVLAINKQVPSLSPPSY